MSLHIVHLVRHGEVDNPHHVVYGSLPGFGLNERGRAQARAVGGRLASHPIRAVIASPLTRAAETAQTVAEAVGLDPRFDERLTEWRIGDRWAGTAWDELDERFPGERSAYLNHPEDLDSSPETLTEVAERVAVLVAEAHAAHDSGDLVLVSHQDTIQAGRLFLTGRPLRELQSDKPAHGSMVTLARQGSNPEWREAAYWAPSGEHAFPPVGDRGNGRPGAAR